MTRKIYSIQENGTLPRAGAVLEGGRCKRDLLPPAASNS